MHENAKFGFLVPTQVTDITLNAGNAWHTVIPSMVEVYTVLTFCLKFQP